MDLDLATFLVALYVIVDDLYQSHLQPRMPSWGGPEVQMSDSEVLCLGLAVQWRSGVPWKSERGIRRYVRTHRRHLFPTVLTQSAFNRRLRRLWGVFLLIQDAVAAQLAPGDYDVMDGCPIPVAHGARAFTPGWLADMARLGQGGNDRYCYGVRMMMVLNQHGVATGWALASGNGQERWGSGVAFQYPCRAPRGARPAGRQGAQTQGDTPRGVDGRRAERRGPVTQAHAQRWRLSWGRLAGARGASLWGPGLPAFPNSASCQSTLVEFGSSGGGNRFGKLAREFWAQVSRCPQHVGSAHADCSESGGV